jgi:hypothetical protein
MQSCSHAGETAIDVVVVRFSQLETQDSNFLMPGHWQVLRGHVALAPHDLRSISKVIHPMKLFSGVPCST